MYFLCLSKTRRVRIVQLCRHHLWPLVFHRGSALVERASGRHSMRGMMLLRIWCFWFCFISQKMEVGSKALMALSIIDFAGHLAETRGCGRTLLYTSSWLYWFMWLVETAILEGMNMLGFFFVIFCNTEWCEIYEGGMRRMLLSMFEGSRIYTLVTFSLAI